MSWLDDDLNKYNMKSDGQNSSSGRSWLDDDIAKLENKKARANEIRQVGQSQYKEPIGTKLSEQAKKEHDYYKAHPLADKIVHNPVSQFWDKKIVPALDVAGTAMRGVITGDYAAADKTETTGNDTADTIAKAAGTIGAFALPAGNMKSVGGTIRTGAEKIVSKIIPNASNVASKVGKMAVTGAVESIPYSAQQVLTQKNIKTPQDALKTVGLNAAIGSGTELVIAGLGAAAKAIYSKIKAGKALTQEDEAFVKKNPQLFKTQQGKDIKHALKKPVKAVNNDKVINVGEPQKLLSAGKIELPKQKTDFYSTTKTTAANLADLNTPPKRPLSLPEGRTVQKNTGSMLDMLKKSVNEPVYKEAAGSIDSPFTATKGELRTRKNPTGIPFNPNLKRLSENIQKSRIINAPDYTLGKGRIDNVNVPLQSKKAVQPPVKPMEQLRPQGDVSLPNVEINTPKTSTSVDELTANSDMWRDKKPLALQRETWDRNIIDIAGEKDGRKVKEALFDPVKVNESNRMRYLNEKRAQVKALNLTKKESKLVQKMGEGKITAEELQGVNTTKIQNAVKVFRQYYDEAINQANEVLTRNGYKPVGKLDNYFPHFQGDDPVMKALGIKLDMVDLPTDINGLTASFKPGKNWFGNFLKREGDKTTFDAVQGFDRYVEGISKVIHHTDDIKRLREFNKTLRMKSLPEDIRNRIGEIMQRKDLSSDEKELLSNELLNNGKTHLSNSVADLEEYTNVLAGKKDLADRAEERRWGRQIYNVVNVVANRIGKNMVAINPASWITNFIPLTQSLATTSKKAFAKGMADTIKNIVKNDGLIDKSTFLTNRIGSDILDKSFIDKTGDVLSAPFKWIDNFTSQVIVRSKYMEGIEKGMAPRTAMQKADEWASKMMGDRSLGSQPTLFNQRNFVTRAFTQFQLEVNNQLSFLLKDMPREYLKDGSTVKNVARLSSAIGQLALYGYLYNQMYEAVVGRRPALDPIGIAFDFKDDFNNPKVKKSKAVLNLVENVANQLPFTSIATGGRIPIGKPVEELISAGSKGLEVATGDRDSKTGLSDAAKSLGKSAAYILPPFGGGQIIKTIEGLHAVRQGGEYSTNAQGERSLKYPIKNNIGNNITAAVFGKSALPETKQYYKEKMKGFSPEQTAAFDYGITKGLNPQKTYDQVQKLRALKPLPGKKSVTDIQKIGLINNNPSFTQQEKTLIINLFVKDVQRKKLIGK